MIHVDISPEVERLFTDVAHAHGLEPEDFARQVLTSAAGFKPQQLSPDELLHGLRALSENATAVTNYPDDFFTREVIYGEHN